MGVQCAFAQKNNALITRSYEFENEKKLEVYNNEKPVNLYATIEQSNEKKQDTDYEDKYTISLLDTNFLMLKAKEQSIKKTEGHSEIISPFNLLKSTQKDTNFIKSNAIISQSYTENAIGCPALNLPTNNSIDEHSLLNLVWFSVPQATNYSLYIGTTNPPTNLVTNTSYTNYQIPTNSPLLPSTTYYWYVKASNATDSCNSSIRNFSTGQLTCATNLLPLNGSTSTNLGSGSALSWDNIRGASNYDVYFGTSLVNIPYLGNVVSNYYNSRITYYHQGNTVLPSTTYYWYVIPKNGNNAASGCQTDIRSFTTPALTCTSNVAPVNGSTLNRVRYDLYWTGQPAANNYDIYLDTNNPPTTFLRNHFINTNFTNGFNPQLPPLAPSTTYYWFVVPKAGTIPAVGCQTSSVTSFTTDTLRCCDINNRVPANNSTGISLQPLIGNASGVNNQYFNNAADSFDVYLGTTNPPPFIFRSIIGSAVGYQVSITNPLLPNTTYYWNMVPRNGNLTPTGCNSNITSFTTTNINCSDNLLPANNATTVNLLPQLTWRANAGYTSYDIYIGTSPNTTTLLTNVTTTNYTFQNTNILMPLTTYYWYIIPKYQNTAVNGCASSITSFTTMPALTCVANISPVNAATGVSAQCTLNWQSSPNATSYNIYYGLNNTAQSLLASNVTTTNYTVPPGLLYLNATYYWYVVPKNGNLAATGCISNVTSFNTSLTCVTNTSPANNSIGLGTLPTLSWQRNLDAQYYELYLGTTNNPTFFIFSVSNSYTIPINNTLIPNTTYYWYVVPKDGNLAATGCASNVTSFTTSLTCVANTSPVNLATGVNIRPTLSWQLSPLATNYDVYLGTSNNPTTLLANVTTNNYTIPIANSLLAGTTYYWYVVPKNGNVASIGCISNVTSFTTLPLASLACVTNISPLDNFPGVSVQPSLSWQSSIVATSYDVYLGTANIPTTLIANVSINSYTIPAANSLLPNTIYYWYVVPKNGNNAATGCTSNITRFTTASLSCVPNVTPPNNTSSGNLYISLGWTSNLAASSYDVYFGTTNPPTTLIANVTTTYYENYITEQLVLGTTYYWYVVPKNGNVPATGCVSNVTSFTAPILSCVGGYMPLNNATNISLTPTFFWSTSQFATNYDLYFGTTNPPTTLLANVVNGSNYQMPLNNLLQEGNTYYWYVVPKNGAATAVGCASVVSSFTTIPSNCIPPYTYGCFGGTGLADFRLFGELGSSIAVTGTVCPASAPYYTNLTSSTNVTLAAGKAYVGNMKSNSTGVYTSIWIDFNNNGGFEVNENLLNSLPNNNSYGTSGVPMPYSIFIPTNAALGAHTMRVRTSYGNVVTSMQACATYQYGETKDFTVTIVPTGTAYAISTKTNCEDLAFTTINAASNNNNTAIPILDNIGNIAATINANGNNLGTITSSIHKNTGAVRQNSSGIYYFDRNLTFTPKTQPISNVGVRLYYTAAELAAFQTAVPTATINSLNVTKTNLGCSTSFAGVDVFLPQTGNGSMGSDYYIDVATPSFSSFYIKNGLGLLPLSVVYFKGSKQQAANILDWKLNCDAGTHINVTLEHSVDGIKFNNLQTQNISDTSCQNPFTYKHYNAVTGSNYYRLKIISTNGEIKYSQVIKLLNKEKGFELVNIVPNPVKNNAVLIITSATTGKIKIVISDVVGKILMNQTLSIIAGNNNIDLNFENITAGTYFIKAINEDGELKTLRFVKY